LPIQKIGEVVEEKKLKVAGAVEVELDALVKPFKGTFQQRATPLSCAPRAMFPAARGAMGFVRTF